MQNKKIVIWGEERYLRAKIPEWINNCQICNDGLCVRFEELKKTGLSERQTAEIMQEEAFHCYPELKKEFCAERIRRRYRYHMNKNVGQIVPKRASWPISRKCKSKPAKAKDDATPVQNGLCRSCDFKEYQSKLPKCKECGAPVKVVNGESFKHGLCNGCRINVLRKDKGLDVKVSPMDREQESSIEIASVVGFLSQNKAAEFEKKCKYLKQVISWISKEPEWKTNKPIFLNLAIDLVTYIDRK